MNAIEMSSVYIGMATGGILGLELAVHRTGILELQLAAIHRLTTGDAGA